MATLATRLTSTGNLLVNGTFDEVTLPSGSLYFDGTGDYLRGPSNSAFAYGTGDFTYEYWLNAFSFSNAFTVWDTRNSSGSGSGLSDYFSANASGAKYNLYVGVSTIYTSSANVLTNVWNHIAVSRQGSTLRVFLNGVLDGSITNSTNFTNQESLIGVNINIVSYTQGYISNLRVTKGTALYTANFNPSISVLESTANTSLLLNVLNSADYIKDNSSNKFNLTRNGDVAYNSLSPFNRGAHSVSNDTVFTRLSDEVSLAAGSVSFDGTDDYLSVANNTALQPGTEAFTIDCWIYRSVANAHHTFYSKGFSSGGGSGTGLQVRVHNTNVLRFTYGTAIIDSTITIPALTWTHVAIVRSSTGVNGFTMYINGVQSGLGTVSTDFNQTEEVRIGTNRQGADFFNGYISNLRFVKGVALYTANFTPQQFIPDSTANTSLLLNVLNSTDFKKDSSPNNFDVIVNGNPAWNANGPFNQNVTGLAERRLSNATLLKDQYDEFTGAPVVDSSLVLWLDAANPASYPTTGTTWTDLSGRGYNSVLTNGPTFNSTLRGGVFLFDGSNDYSTLTGIPDSIWQGNWTASFWVYFNTVSSSTFGSQDKTLIHHGSASTRNGLHLCQRNSRVHFGLYGDDLQGNTIVNAGVWYNLVYTLNNSTYLKQIYINSVLDTPNAGYTDVGLGAYTGTGTNTRLAGPFIFSGLYFDGFIGAVSLFNRVLSSDEVAQNFNANRRRYGL